MPVQVPLGTDRIGVSLPDCDVERATPPGGASVDPRTAAETAVADPHGPPLDTRLDSGDDVAVVVTDVTRDTPTEALLDVLFDAMGLDPVDDRTDRDRTTIILGLGLHRPMTEAEIGAGLGAYAPLAVNNDPEEVVQVGSVEGVPIETHPAVAEADTVFSTGLVEPHQYAGFSGGAKTVVVGAGGESVIGHTHGPELLGQPGVRLGRISDNPFREFIDRAGDRIGIDACLNVTRSPAGILDAAAGNPRAVVSDLAETAGEAMAVPVGDGYDAVIAGVGAPKDASLYQASRGATAVALGARNPLRAGGRIVTPARLPEGGGQGRGEQRFADWLASAASAAALYEEMASGYEPGAQRAFVLARVLRDHDVWITNSEAPDLVEDSLCHAAPTVAEAIPSGSDVLVVPDALHTLLVPD
jgi:nickel-dependent lactate racemase